MSALTPEIELVRAVYTALNRGDIPAAVAPLAEDIDWIEPAEYTGSATCHNRADLQAHLTRARATWAEGACEPEHFETVGDKVVVTLYVQVRLKTETEFRTGRHAAAWTFRNGEAIEMRIFDDPQQAIAWAKISLAHI